MTLIYDFACVLVVKKNFKNKFLKLSQHGTTGRVLHVAYFDIFQKRLKSML